jgi:hypothetical protein
MNHLLDTFDYHFRTFFHTFLIHFQYPLQFEIEANAKPIIYAKYRIICAPVHLPGPPTRLAQ